MDLQLIGVDLGEYYSRQRYWTLLTLIDGLPSHSRFHQAIFSDPEQVALLLQRERERDPEDIKKDGKKDSPELYKNSPEVEAIKDLRDSVEILCAITAAVGGGEYEPKPSRRPEFGFEDELKKIRENNRARAANSLISILTPDFIIQ